MIEQVQLFFKDPVKIVRLSLGGFFFAVLMTTYWLSTLPDDLVYEGGMIDSGRAGGVYAKLFIVIALAFAFCYAAIHFTQKVKRETIVYLDKKAEGTSGSHQGASSGQAQGSLDVTSLRDKIAKQKKQDEKLQQGLNYLCDQLNAGQGALYTVHKKGDSKSIELKSAYALVLAEGEKNPSFDWGEGLIGQVAASAKSTYLDELPEGYAARIESGLGSALPKFLFMFPLKKENEITGVIEVATFTALSENVRQQAQEAGNVLAEIS